MISRLNRYPIRFISKPSIARIIQPSIYFSSDQIPSRTSSPRKINYQNIRNLSNNSDTNNNLQSDSQSNNQSNTNLRDKIDSTSLPIYNFLMQDQPLNLRPPLSNPTLTNEISIQDIMGINKRDVSSNNLIPELFSEDASTNISTDDILKIPPPKKNNSKIIINFQLLKHEYQTSQLYHYLIDIYAFRKSRFKFTSFQLTQIANEMLALDNLNPPKRNSTVIPKMNFNITLPEDLFIDFYDPNLSLPINKYEFLDLLNLLGYWRFQNMPQILFDMFKKLPYQERVQLFTMLGNQEFIDTHYKYLPSNYLQFIKGNLFCLNAFEVAIDNENYEAFTYLYNLALKGQTPPPSLYFTSTSKAEPLPPNKKKNPPSPISVELSNLVARKGNIVFLGYLYDHKCPWNAGTIIEALKHNQLSAAQYLLDHNCPVNQKVVFETIKLGHLSFLKSLTNVKSLQLQKDVMYATIEHNQLPCFEYLFSLSQPKFSNFITSELGPLAAKYNRVDFLQYLFQQQYFHPTKPCNHPCKSFSLSEKVDIQTKTVFSAIESGNLSAFQFCFDNKFSIPNNIISYAIQHKQFACVQDLVSKKYPLTEECLHHAISLKDMTMINYLIEKKCPGNTLVHLATLGDLSLFHQNTKFTLKNQQNEALITNILARQGQVKLLAYTYHNNYHWPNTVIEYCVQNGHLTCLQYVMKKRFSVDYINTHMKYQLPAIAAKYGQIECLKYLHEQGVEWNETTCTMAASNGHKSSLKYAHTHGCPWDENTTLEAIRNKHLSCLNYAINRDCPHSSLLTKEAAITDSKINFIKYVSEKQIPWHEDTCLEAVKHLRIANLIQAHKLGAPLTGDLISLAIQNKQLKIVKYCYDQQMPVTSDHLLLSIQPKSPGIPAHDIFDYLLFYAKCPIDYRVAQKAAQQENLYYLQTLHKLGYKFDEQVMLAAALKGSLEAIRFLHSVNCPWDEDVILAAASSGHFPCLLYLHKHKCPWDKRLTHAAAVNGHLNCFHYAHQFGCPWDQNIDFFIKVAGLGDMKLFKYLHQMNVPWDKRVIHEAAKNNHTDLVKYAHQNKCPWDQSVLIEAVKNGNLELVKYAHKHGVPWNEQVPAIAASRGYYEILQTAHDTGCPWDASTTANAAENGHGDCFIYAHKLGCPCEDISIAMIKAAELGDEKWLKYVVNNGGLLTKEVMNAAVSNGHLELIKYLHTRGCPWDEEATRMAALQGRLEILQYLHKKGCPWDELVITYAENYRQNACLDYALTHGCPKPSVPTLFPNLQGDYENDLLKYAISSEDKIVEESSKKDQEIETLLVQENILSEKNIETIVNDIKDIMEQQQEFLSGNSVASTITESEDEDSKELQPYMDTDPAISLEINDNTVTLQPNAIEDNAQNPPDVPHPLSITEIDLTTPISLEKETEKKPKRGPKSRKTASTSSDSTVTSNEPENLEETPKPKRTRKSTKPPTDLTINPNDQEEDATKATKPKRTRKSTDLPTELTINPNDQEEDATKATKPKRTRKSTNLPTELTINPNDQEEEAPKAPKTRQTRKTKEQSSDDSISSDSSNEINPTQETPSITKPKRIRKKKVESEEI